MVDVDVDMKNAGTDGKRQMEKESWSGNQGNLGRERGFTRGEMCMKCNYCSMPLIGEFTSLPKIPSTDAA